MSDREKLIELLAIYDSTYDCDFCPKDQHGGLCGNGCLADHLISNGVTVQKWIPVSEPPKTGGSYLVTTEKGAVCTAHFYKNGDVGKWSTGRTIVVTHWKRLPMPAKRCE